MHLPFASAKWQRLWRMHRICQSVIVLILLPFCFSEMARPPHSPIIRPMPLAGQWQSQCIRLWRMHRRMQCLAIRFSEWQMANAERHCTDTECRQYNKSICLMFYFSQSRNQTKPLEKKERKAERTRCNLKTFYKICPIFDNIE